MGRAGLCSLHSRYVCFKSLYQCTPSLTGWNRHRGVCVCTCEHGFNWQFLPRGPLMPMLNGGVYQVEDIAGLLPHLGLMGHRRGNVHPPTKTIYLDSSDRSPTAITLSLPQLRPLRLLWRSGGKIQKKGESGWASAVGWHNVWADWRQADCPHERRSSPFPCPRVSTMNTGTRASGTKSSPTISSGGQQARGPRFSMSPGPFQR